MEEFIDIHSHILPEIDDGSHSYTESLEMLSIAKKDGIAVMVAAPHYIEGKYEPEIVIIEDLIAKLKSETDTPDIIIGADIRISHKIPQKIMEGLVPKINYKNYILLELPGFSLPPLESLAIFTMRLKEKGINTILTHPERHPIIIRDVDIIHELYSMGLYMQVTAMSLTGDFGRVIQDFTMYMFKNDLVHVIASDAHDIVKRPPILSKSYERIKKEFGGDNARLVAIENPLRIVNGEKIL